MLDAATMSLALRNASAPASPRGSIRFFDELEPQQEGASIRRRSNRSSMSSKASLAGGSESVALDALLDEGYDNEDYIPPPMTLVTVSLQLFLVTFYYSLVIPTLVQVSFACSIGSSPFADTH